MGANLSQRRRRDSVLAAPLGDFDTWTLIAGCSRCQKRRQIAVAELLDHVVPDETVAAVLRRLRCDGCGAAPSFVAIRYRGHQVVLTGPGALE